MAALALSSLEAMLNLMMGRSTGGGENALIDNDVLNSSPLPPLPVRPSPRCRRRPSQQRRLVIFEISAPRMLQPRSSSCLKEEEDTGKRASTLIEELEGKVAMAEARLRQKEEENAMLKQKFEDYHVRWLYYEIRLSSLKETIDEQMISLQAAQEYAEKRSREMLSSYDHHKSSKSHIKMSEKISTRVRHGYGHHVGVTIKSIDVELRQQSKALVKPREPWQPGTPSSNSIDDLKKLKSQFYSWKMDYKARLRKAMDVELNLERRHRSICWI